MITARRNTRMPRFLSLLAAAAFVGSVISDATAQAVTDQEVLDAVDTGADTINSTTQGDRAVVTLMSYPDTPIESRVDSIGWGIVQKDGSTGFELLPLGDIGMPSSSCSTREILS